MAEWRRGPFVSLADFFRPVVPQPEEMEIMIRLGGFDEFGQSRTAQFWGAQQAQRAFGQSADGQGWLLPASGLQRLREVLLAEPTRHQRLQ